MASADRRYLRDSIVLALAIGVFGASFGVLASAAGLSVLKTCALSLLVFTGASQFAVVGVWAAGGSPVSAIGSGLLLAARNAAYGLALAPLVVGRTRRRLVAAQLTIDESAAMAAAQTEPRAAARAFWATGLSVYVTWNLGTLLGATVGSTIGDPRKLGLDAALPAGFIALAMPHLKTVRGRVAAAAGATIALVLMPLTPAGTPILAAALGVFPAVLLAPPDPSEPADT
jgi:4-azaleucine resistance transporter AzlC